MGALESVIRAAPYGEPPEVLRSVDGKTYLHWQFHRSAIYACSTPNVCPFILAWVVRDAGRGDSSSE